jgi:hypothetical protein
MSASPKPRKLTLNEVILLIQASAQVEALETPGITAVDIVDTLVKR